MRIRDAMVTGRTDASLLLDFARGDRGALDALVERRWAGAYRVALHSLGDPGAAEDAAADAFAALVRSAPRFAPERPFGPWFAAVLLNAIKKQERARRRRERHERRAAEARPATVDADADADLDTSRVEPLLRDLPLDLRLPLVLHFYEGRTHAEVADALGCPVGTASSRIRRGLERLRGSLAGAGALAGSLPSIEALGAALGAARPSPATPAAPGVARLEELARRATRPALLATLAGGVAIATLALGALLVDVAPVAGVASSAGRVADPAAATTRVDAPSPDVGAASGASSEGGESAPVGSSLEASSAQAPAQDRRVVGRIVDQAGAQVAGARVTVSMQTDRVTVPEGLALHPFERARRLASAPPERRVDAFRALRWGRAVVDLGGATSDDDGRFAVAVPAGVRSLNVSAAATKDGAVVVGAAHLNDDDVDVGELALCAVRRVRVTVTSAGVTLPGADVHLSVPTSDREDEDFWAYARTDSTGSALLEDPFGWMGVQTVVVVAPGHAIEARQAEGDEDFQMAVELVPGVTARTRVTDDAGRPLEGVEVEARAVGDTAWFVVARGRSGPDGVVTLPGLTPGRAYTLDASAPGPDLLDAEEVVSAAAVLPELRVHAPVALIVTASADADGFMARDQVTLQRLVNGRWSVAHSEPPRVVRDGVRGELLTFDDDDVPPDRVHFPRLRPGTYRAIAELDGCATVVSAPLTLAPGASAQAVALRLAPGRSARGRVVDAAGKPVSGASVNLRLGDHDVHLGDANEDGAFETTQLPMGPRPEDAVLVVHEAFMGPEAQVPLAADATWLGDVVIERDPSDLEGDEEDR